MFALIKVCFYFLLFKKPCKAAIQMRLTNFIFNTVPYVCVNKSLFLFSSVQKAVQSGHSNASSTAAAGLQQKKWIMVNL